MVESNMSALYRSVFHVGKKIIFADIRRGFTVSPIARFKEIIETKEGKTRTFEGRIIPDAAESRLLKKDNPEACALCSLGIEIKYTDVLILSQFLRPDGCILPKRITGLCAIQQRRLEHLVAMAQKAGLMSNLTPARSKKDPEKRFKWKKYNTYFDETTIKPSYKNVLFRE